jgi:hypothetical protein
LLRPKLELFPAPQSVLIKKNLLLKVSRLLAMICKKHIRDPRDEFNDEIIHNEMMQKLFEEGKKAFLI